MTHFRGTLLAVLAALATLLAFAACGDDDSSPFVRTSTPSATTPGQTTAAAPATTVPPATTAPAGAEYVVRAGDTLVDIAARFGIDAELLALANDIADPTTLQVGQVLVIPGVDPLPTTPAGATTVPAVTATPGPSIGLLALVDKQHALPSEYVPPDLVALSGGYVVDGFGQMLLREEAAGAAVRMMDAAYAEGIDARVQSAYRSYAQQEQTFAYWVSQLGYDEATRVSAMPGHSEHQLGLAVDMASPGTGCDLGECFGDTPAGLWLAAHAHEYGFALSYPKGKEAITGYAYEPWHFRYIGVQAAAEWKASGLTLNQFLASR